VGGAVQEGEPGEVRRHGGIGEEVGVKRATEVVGRDQVGPVVTDDRRSGRDGIQGPSQAGPNGPLFARTTRADDARGPVGGPGEVEQMRPFGIVELQGASDRIQDSG